MNTDNTHRKRFYENGRSNPYILVESESDGDFVEYASGSITDCITEYDGKIPGREESRITEGSVLYVWHHEKSSEKAENAVIREHETIDTKTAYVSNETGLDETISNFSDVKVGQKGWDEARKNFFRENLDGIDSYCDTLITCNCGHRNVHSSISESLADKIEHNLKDHNPTVWYYCGCIDDKTSKDSYFQYESSMSIFQRAVNTLSSSKKRPPIMTVPIYMTPFSIALSKVGGYNINSYDSLPS